MVEIVELFLAGEEYVWLHHYHEKQMSLPPYSFKLS